MGHDQGGGRGEFDGEVAIGHGVEGVLAQTVETELPGNHLAIDGEGGTRQRARAQRQPVDAGTAVAQPAGITVEHLVIGHEVVAEGHGLGHLQVGEARHDQVRVALGQVEQHDTQVAQVAKDAIDGVAQPEPDVGGDLIVAGTSGVQTLAGVAHQLGEAALDVEVHVLGVE